MWTYEQVKAADTALSPAISDPGAAAAALNGQTTSAPVTTVNISDIQNILFLSAEWLAVEAASAQSYSASWPASPTPEDEAISAAKLAVGLAGSKTNTILPADFPAVQAFLGALEQAGVISAGSITKINALYQSPTPIPAWQPPLDAGIIQTARAQP